MSRPVQWENGKKVVRPVTEKGDRHYEKGYTPVSMKGVKEGKNTNLRWKNYSGENR